MEDNTFLTLYRDEDIEVILEKAPSFMGGVFIHTKVNTFSVSKFKKYKALWKEIVKYLNANNIQDIYALPPDEQAEKWETKFSFVDTGVCYEGQKIMKYRGE